MKHRIVGRSFGRRPAQAKALMRGLATALIERERIETTISKAKELRRVVEPLVTLGKKGSIHARRKAREVVYGRAPLAKLFDELSPRFKERSGGYTRIFRLGQRRGDGAEMAVIEFLPAEKSKPKGGDKKKAKGASKKSPVKAKKAEKAAPAAKKKAATKKKATKKGSKAKKDS